MMIDRVVLEEAAILTAIGISTAFALLVTLMALAVIVRLVAEIMEKCAIRMAMSKAAKEEAKSLDLGHAAIAAVTMLMVTRARSDMDGDGNY